MAKLAIPGLTFLLIVGVIIGAIAILSHSKSKRTVPVHNKNIANGMKAVEKICAATDNKELCLKTLEPAATDNGSLTFKDLLKTYYVAILEEVKKAFHQANSMEKYVNSSYDTASMEECKRLITYAIHDIQEAITTITQSGISELSGLSADLNNCLGAVLSHRLFCLYPLKNPEMARVMNEGLATTDLQVSNALAIVDEIDKTLGNIKGAISPQNPRQLLGVNDDGFPAWLNPDDRKRLEMENNQITPDTVVAQDGSGQYKTITEALANNAKRGSGRYVIYVKEGIYKEYVVVNGTHVFLYGDGSSKTVITGDKNARQGLGTSQTATVTVNGKLFMAKSIAFHNTAGSEGEQAVALGVLSDKSVFYDCAIQGYQDTLLTQSNRQFYLRCVISGTIDFIFGSGSAMIKDSDIMVRMPAMGQFNAITADGRTNPRVHSGISIQGCRILAEDSLEQQKMNTKSYLGRPWKQYARTMVMESDIGDFINPEGWHVWNDATNYHQTCEYREYANHGPGADVRGRVKWPGFKVVTDETEARQFKAAQFFKGKKPK